jgi:hypothetical protein
MKGKAANGESGRDVSLENLRRALPEEYTAILIFTQRDS